MLCRVIRAGNDQPLASRLKNVGSRKTSPSYLNKELGKIISELSINEDPGLHK